jgi:pantoate--beta-alanine ligase
VDVIRTESEASRVHGGVIVPTMGSLHSGHSALLRHAARIAAGRHPVVATVFVNPTQFNESVDFDRYPRDLDADLAAAATAGATVVFAPDVATVYPPDAEIAVPPLPELATAPGLEDRYRPGHLAGVAQVVARLFDLLRPRAAIFGEKDWQQLLLVRAVVEHARTETPERWPGLEVVGAPTIREDDGLALSSRNLLLSEDARRAARGIPRALQMAHSAQHPDTAERLMLETLAAHDLEVEYAAVRDAATLRPIADFRRPARGLIAARVGGVRLIDNQPMTVWR